MITAIVKSIALAAALSCMRLKHKARKAGDMFGFVEYGQQYLFFLLVVCLA